MARTVGSDRLPLIQRPGTRRFSNRNLGVRATTCLGFSLQQQQEAEHALVVALFCAPDQLFDECGTFAVTQFHRLTPKLSLARKNELWKSGEAPKKR